MTYEIGRTYWSRSTRKLIIIIGMTTVMAICQDTDNRIKSLSYRDLSPATTKLPAGQYEEMRHAAEDAG